MLFRRSVIAAVPALLVGCSIHGGGSEQLLDEEIHLSSGEYRAFEFEIQTERSVSFGFRGDGETNLDIFFLPHNEFAAYERGDEFEYRYTSGLDVAGGFTEDENVDPGSYVVVFDNTDRGEAVPSQPVSGRVEVTVEPTS